MKNNHPDFSTALAPPVSLVPGVPAPAPKVEAKFKVGDTVKMISSGPNMTIGKVTDDGRVEVCWWHEGDLTFSGALFFQDMLILSA